MAKNTRKKEANKVEGKVFVCLNRANGIVFKIPDERKVAISGNAAHLRGKESGVLPAGAFGMTLVDAADWEWIKATYGGMEIFRSGLIFARDNRESALDESAEKEETRHGLEAASTRQPFTAPSTPEAGA